jgi:ABC-type multidrug transport system fused ATPase/permease subunit
MDCNIDLLDTLTLSVLVTQTARDLKKSPRKLILSPSSAVLILLLRVVLPLLTATFLTDIWFELSSSFDLVVPNLTLCLRFGAVLIRSVVSITVSYIANKIFADISKED